MGMRAFRLYRGMQHVGLVCGRWSACLVLSWFWLRRGQLFADWDFAQRVLRVGPVTVTRGVKR